jgi:hypothetical protein
MSQSSDIISDIKTLLYIVIAALFITSVAVIITGIGVSLVISNVAGRVNDSIINGSLIKT